MGQRNKGIHSKDNLNENYFDKRFESYSEHENTCIGRLKYIPY